MHIPWDAQAHFNDIDGGESFTGSLADCVRAYEKLAAERRHGALITSDKMVQIPNQPTAINNLDHEALDWLAERLSERDR